MSVHVSEIIAGFAWMGAAKTPDSEEAVVDLDNPDDPEAVETPLFSIADSESTLPSTEIIPVVEIGPAPKLSFELLDTSSFPTQRQEQPPAPEIARKNVLEQDDAEIYIVSTPELSAEPSGNELLPKIAIDRAMVRSEIPISIFVGKETLNDFNKMALPPETLAHSGFAHRLRPELAQNRANFTHQIDQHSADTEIVPTKTVSDPINPLKKFDGPMSMQFSNAAPLLQKPAQAIDKISFNHPVSSVAPILAPTAVRPTVQSKFNMSIEADTQSNVSETSIPREINIGQGLNKTPSLKSALQVPNEILTQITAKLLPGPADRLEIRLDPQELGRLSIQITQSESGTVVVVLAEKAEVSEFLRRHAEVLTKELEKSGFGTATLEFAGKNPRGEAHKNGGRKKDRHEISEVDASQSVRDTNPISYQSNGLDIRL